jgi:hypothetical protein
LASSFLRPIVRRSVQSHDSNGCLGSLYLHRTGFQSVALLLHVAAFWLSASTPTLTSCSKKTDHPSSSHPRETSVSPPVPTRQNCLLRNTSQLAHRLLACYRPSQCTISLVRASRRYRPIVFCLSDPLACHAPIIASPSCSSQKGLRETTTAPITILEGQNIFLSPHCDE